VKYFQNISNIEKERDALATVAGIVINISNYIKN
jgi:hypothetical protein